MAADGSREGARGSGAGGPGAQAARRCPPTLTPQSHEDGEDHGALVVEEVRELGEGAGVRELLVPAAVVAARAQEDVVGLADLLADLAGVEQGEAAEEDEEAHGGGGHQHVGVPAEPGEVQGHLLAEVVPDVVDRLRAEHAPPLRPLLPEVVLPLVQHESGLKHPTLHQVVQGVTSGRRVV